MNLVGTEGPCQTIKTIVDYEPKGNPEESSTMGAASTPDSPRALVCPVRPDPGAESRRRASPVPGHGADFSMRVAQMLMGPINMSSNAVGRKQGRDYNFRAARGPPDQPLLGGDSGQESLGSVRPPDSAGSRQGSPPAG